MNSSELELQNAKIAGYKEALLDVYLYLTGDERIGQYPERLPLLENMVKEVNKKSNRLAEVA